MQEEEQVLSEKIQHWSSYQNVIDWFPQHVNTTLVLHWKLHMGARQTAPRTATSRQINSATQCIPTVVWCLVMWRAVLFRFGSNCSASFADPSIVIQASTYSPINNCVMNLTSRVAASGRDRYEDKTCVCDFVIKTQRWYQSTAVFTHFLIVRCLRAR